MHISVLKEEVIKNLKISEDGIYVDATLGMAGHSMEILKRIKKGFLFAFDQDDYAISYSLEKLSSIGNNFALINDNFSNMKKCLLEKNVTKVSGVLFDLGVSSPQLDNLDRGFSFHNDAKLDMRMNRNSKLTAYEVVNNYSYEKLVEIFFKYGEEKYAKSIASNIIKKREEKKIETTLELVDIIKNSIPFKAKKDKHPARCVFQAIRIEVNNELEVLKKGLVDALDLLDVGGRICVITFHSLEDRIVKDIFRKYTSVSSDLKDLPYVPKEMLPKFRLVNKNVIIPTEEEINKNKRSRSAKLRIIERVEYDG